MDGKYQPSHNIPYPDRLAALRSLPRDVVQSLSREEIRAFLHEDVWPDSLKEKLKRYMVEDD
ncbi:MAG: hypothetical protein JRJ29_12410 [Deltaproteobacteria bacterium]|nr:hypothetical protein [Deltaproteobacteria bacterium]